MTEDSWLDGLVETMLPVEGYVAANELADDEDGIKAATVMLDMLVETGRAIAILTILGDKKEWMYGRLYSRPI